METRIPVSLKLETTDELYYALVEPLRANRNLSSFIISLFDAYLHDSKIHDMIDDYISRNSSVEKIRSHIQHIAELQGKNMRLIEDFDSTIESSMSNNVVENRDDILERLSSLEIIVSKLANGVSSVSTDISSNNGTVENISQNNSKNGNSGFNGSVGLENKNGVVYGGIDKNGLQGIVGDSTAIVENDTEKRVIVEDSVVENVSTKSSNIENESSSNKNDTTSDAEDLLGGFMDSLF